MDDASYDVESSIASLSRARISSTRHAGGAGYMSGSTVVAKSSHIVDAFPAAGERLNICMACIMHGTCNMHFRSNC